MTLQPLDVPPAVPLAGRLLVAAPVLTDPTFSRAVVLLLDHDEEGSLGLVLNRPSHVPVGAVLPPWDGRTTGTDVLFTGGPVAEDSALALGLHTGPEDGPEPDGFRRVAGPFGLVDLDLDPDESLAEIDAIRIYAGYSGWSAGQLEDEIAEGAWWPVPAQPGDALGDDPAGLWRRVLRRQPGTTGWFANCPLNPSAN